MHGFIFYIYGWSASCTGVPRLVDDELTGQGQHAETMPPKRGGVRLVGLEAMFPVNIGRSMRCARQMFVCAVKHPNQHSTFAL